LPSLHISHQDHPSQTVWSTPAGQNFVSGADIYLTIVAERASVEIDEHKQAQFSHRMVDRIEQEEDAIAIYGRLQRSQPASDEPQYVLSLRSLGSKELNFQLQIAGEKVNQAQLRFASSPEEHFYGLGEQFSYIDGE
jgi:alpha-glucosidase